MTEREQILNDYAHIEQSPIKLITSPGKFEGEPIFAPHFWSVGLEGFADGDDGQCYAFKFKNGDKELTEWPELKHWLGRKRTLRMVEGESGFVHCF